jgi:hypothetical protein
MANKCERETGHKMDSVARYSTIHLHGLSVFVFKLVAPNKRRRADVGRYRVELGLEKTVQLGINGNPLKEQASVQAKWIGYPTAGQ